MQHLFAAFLLAILVSTQTAGQGLSGGREKIRQLMDDRQHAGALDELRRFEAADRQTFTRGNYDYLLARIAEKDGRLGEAMPVYYGAAARESPFQPYARERMAALARSTGNLMLERLYLDEIVQFSPESVPSAAAGYRLPRSHFDRGDYRGTIRLLTQISAAPDTTEEGDPRPSQKLLGEALLRDGQASRAREIFAALLASDPNPGQPDDVSLAAVKALDQMDGGTDTEAAPLGEAEHWRRANIYQFSREYGRARLHFTALVDSYPDSQKASDALFQIGRGHAQVGEFGEAIKSYERILETYPQSPVAKETLLNTGSAYARLGRSREAISRYQAFIDRYPADEKLDRAYLNIVDIHRDQDADTEALAWCEKTRAVFVGKLPAALALFASPRIHISKEDWPNAIGVLDQLRREPNLGGAAVPGGTSRAEIDFLTAFALEQSRRHREAIDAYLAIQDGREEYYGWRATQRLLALGDDQAARSLVAEKVARLTAGLGSSDEQDSRAAAQAILRITKDPALRERALGRLRTEKDVLPSDESISSSKISGHRTTTAYVTDQFLALGLYEEAARGMHARAGSPTYETARVQTRGNRADLGLAFIEPIWRKVPADHPIDLIPRAHAQLLYPTPFADELLAIAPGYGVDPRLVLAIMRQESRFRPDARSYASARGLMQFIPETSRLVAGELGREVPLEDDLYHPTTAIRFGSHYVASLFRAFPGQPEAVAASYNGGDDNMLRWLRRSRSTISDRYVPEIAYAQTKDYVYRVMANYRMYQHLYDENLPPAIIEMNKPERNKARKAAKGQREAKQPFDLGRFPRLCVFASLRATLSLFTTFLARDKSAAVILSLALAIAACGGRSSSNRDNAALTRYPLKGKVVSVNKAEKKAKVEHEAIEGFMPAMTMDFPIRAYWVWEDLTPGADIRAELVVDNTAKEPYWLENIGIVASPNPNQPPLPINENFAQVGKETPDFSLVNQDGKKISLKDYRGKALAITFIYAQCPLPEYCIKMSTIFSDLALQLNADAELKNKVRLLSISFDPANDTPEKLKSYGTGYLGKGAKPDFTVWQLAVGTDAEVRRIAEFFGLRYEIDPNDKTQFNHSLRTAVIAPDGRVTKIFAGNDWTAADLLGALKAANE